MWTLLFYIWTLLFYVWTPLFYIWTLLFYIWTLLFYIWTLLFYIWTLLFSIWTLLFSIWTLLMPARFSPGFWRSPKPGLACSCNPKQAPPWPAGQVVQALDYLLVPRWGSAVKSKGGGGCFVLKLSACWTAFSALDNLDIDCVCGYFSIVEPCLSVMC